MNGFGLLFIYFAEFFLFWIWFCMFAILSDLLYSASLCLFCIQVEAKLVWIHIKRLTEDFFQ